MMITMIITIMEKNKGPKSNNSNSNNNDNNKIFSLGDSDRNYD